MCESSVCFRAPHFVCSGIGSRQIVILKTKIKPVNINSAASSMNILYDLMMQCLHCLRNVHDWTTLFICRQMISSKTLPYIFIYHYPYIIFCKCHLGNQVWNWYGSMEDCLPFHSWNLPFHSILASSIFHTEISVPFHTMPCSKVKSWQGQVFLQLFFTASDSFLIAKNLRSRLQWFELVLGILDCNFLLLFFFLHATIYCIFC